MSKTLTRSLLLLALLGLVYGCGDDDDPAGPGVTNPTGTFSINGGDEMTTTRDVELVFDITNADSMRFHNSDAPWTDWAPIPPAKTTMVWELDDNDGMKTVYAEFKNTEGGSLAIDDDIELDTVRTRVLILDDDGTEGNVQAVLSDAGYTVTMGGHYQDWVSTDFSAYDLVVLLYGVDYGDTIAVSVQQGMKDFVNAGGVLLTTEWLTYQGDSDEGDPDVHWATLIDILPLAYNDDYCDDGDGACPENYTRIADHPITSGLPMTFAMPHDWTYSMTLANTTSVLSNIQVLFRGSVSGDALAVGDFGLGHTLHWNMAGVYDGTDIWSTETELILTNIAAFAE